MGALLAITTICGIEVSPREQSSSSTGVIVVDDIAITAETVVSNLETPVPVQSAFRRGTAVYLRFSTSTPPAEVALHKLRRPVRVCRPRPLQCGRCGRLDHATASCDRERRCWRCGGSHLKAVCKTAKPYCTNCGGPHAVLDHSCPRWQEERRVCEELVRAQAPASRMDVRAALRAATQPRPPPVAPATMRQQPGLSTETTRMEQRQQTAQQQPSNQAAPARSKRGPKSSRNQPAARGQPHPDPNHG